MSDFPAYCARPACRKEIRSARRYRSTECEQAARRELGAARARLRSLRASVRQASADVATFTDHDDVHWPQTWREAETYLAAIDLADNRVPAIELVETWWSRTFDNEFLCPGGRGVDVDVGDPATLADYLRARDTAQGTSPHQRAALATARYLEESARREDLRWLLRHWRNHKGRQ